MKKCIPEKQKKVRQMKIENLKIELELRVTLKNSEYPRGKNKPHMVSQSGVIMDFKKYYLVRCIF